MLSQSSAVGLQRRNTCNPAHCLCSSLSRHRIKPLPRVRCEKACSRLSQQCSLSSPGRTGRKHARGAHVDQRFPECKDLHALYRKCFAQQPFRWGQATGTTEDKCEDAYEAFRECVENSLEKQKDKK